MRTNELMLYKNMEYGKILDDMTFLMENYDKALEYTNISTESSGKAMEKFNSYQDSMAAHMDNNRRALQDFSRTMLDSNFLKSIVDFGTGALDVLTDLTDKIGVLSSWGGNISNLGSTLGAISGLVMNKFGAGERTKFQW